MLVETLEKGFFLPPFNDIKPFTGLSEPTKLCHAGKITPKDRHIDWCTWTADDILLRQRVLGKLWDDEIYQHCSSIHAPGESKGELKRVNYHEWRFPDADATVGNLKNFTRNELLGRIPLKGAKVELNHGAYLSPGAPCWVQESAAEPYLGIVTCDGRVVCPTSATIEGRPQGAGITELMRILTQNQQRIYTI